MSEGTIELPPEFLRRDAPLAQDDLILAELYPAVAISSRSRRQS